MSDNGTPQLQATAEMRDCEIRNKLITGFIKALVQDPDERAPALIEKLQEQQAEVQERWLAAIKKAREEQGIPEPPPVVVSMKPLRMQGTITNPQGR